MTIKNIVFCEAIHYIANCVFEIIICIEDSYLLQLLHIG